MAQTEEAAGIHNRNDIPEFRHLFVSQQLSRFTRVRLTASPGLSTSGPGPCLSNSLITKLATNLQVDSHVARALGHCSQQINQCRSDHLKYVKSLPFARTVTAGLFQNTITSSAIGSEGLPGRPAGPVARPKGKHHTWVALPHGGSILPTHAGPSVCILEQVKQRDGKSAPSGGKLIQFSQCTQLWVSPKS